jgi:hypothetical protein
MKGRRFRRMTKYIVYFTRTIVDAHAADFEATSEEDLEQQIDEWLKNNQRYEFEGWDKTE